MSAMVARRSVTSAMAMMPRGPKKIRADAGRDDAGDGQDRGPVGVAQRLVVAVDVRFQAERLETVVSRDAQLNDRGGAADPPRRPARVSLWGAGRHHYE